MFILLSVNDAKYHFGFSTIFPKTGKNKPGVHDLPVLSNNKAPDYDKLVITTSDVGSRKYPIAYEGTLAQHLGIAYLSPNRC